MHRTQVGLVVNNLGGVGDPLILLWLRLLLHLFRLINAGGGTEEGASSSPLTSMFFSIAKKSTSFTQRLVAVPERELDLDAEEVSVLHGVTWLSFNAPRTLIIICGIMISGVERLRKAEHKSNVWNVLKQSRPLPIASRRAVDETLRSRES